MRGRLNVESGRDVSRLNRNFLVVLAGGQACFLAIQLQCFRQRFVKIRDQLLARFPLAIDPRDLFDPANPPRAVAIDDRRVTFLRSSRSPASLT